MDLEKYIASGILELYVAGALSKEDNIQVYRYALEYPQLKEEIQAIEASVLALSRTISPRLVRKKGFDDLKVRIGERKDITVIQLPKKKRNWAAVFGWAIALLLGAGLLWYYNRHEEMTSELNLTKDENAVLEQQIFEARNALANAEQLVAVLRGKDFISIPLDGQEASPEAYARIYWNKNEQKVYLDAIGLPEPPEGTVYQVWSMKADQTSHTSLGLLKDFRADTDKIFALNSPADTEVFGISLEPSEGSETPTEGQFYALGELNPS